MTQFIYSVTGRPVYNRKKYETTDPPYYERIGVNPRHAEYTVVLTLEFIQWCHDNLSKIPDLRPQEFARDNATFIGPHLYFDNEDDAFLFKMTWL